MHKALFRLFEKKDNTLVQYESSVIFRLFITSFRESKFWIFPNCLNGLLDFNALKKQMVHVRGLSIKYVHFLNNSKLFYAN